MKKTVARTVYNIASNSAKGFIRRNISEFRLGGPGIVVLVDTFPDIHSNIRKQEYNSRSRLILCIAEIKVVYIIFIIHFFSTIYNLGIPNKVLFPLFGALQ